MSVHVHEVKFAPGDEISFSEGIKLKMKPDYAEAALILHLNGKWGMVTREEEALNEKALREGHGAMVSIFPLPDDDADFWVVTTPDRSKTMVLLPSEY